MMSLKPNTQRQTGFTLVEIMIALSIGLVISASIIQVMVSNSTTERLNRAVASTQESGRYIMARLNDELLMVGLYDAINPNLSKIVDIAEEESFLRNHPIPLPGDFSERTGLGALQGASGANDTLVVSLQGTHDCRGFKLGYSDNEEFYVVNEYFVDDGKLKCRGFDGRVLRGQRSAVGHNNHAAFTILDDVLSFQVTYGLADPRKNDGETMPTQYVPADQLADAFNANKQVVGIRVSIVVKGEGEFNVDRAASFKLLNESSFNAPQDGIYKAFESTIMLRNMRNFSRGTV